MRKNVLVNGRPYHVISRSIAGFKIFNNDSEFQRMIDLLSVLKYKNFNYKYSRFLELNSKLQSNIIQEIKESGEQLIDLVAYCLMPTHVHLLLIQKTDDGIQDYLSRVLNSYSRHFNLIHKRIGPLWSGRFKGIAIDDDDQLMHITRYIHLNPVSAGLVTSLQEWRYSSLPEYLSNTEELCAWKNYLVFKSAEYQKFVSDRIDYQKKLSSIKAHLIDDYSG